MQMPEPLFPAIRAPPRMLAGYFSYYTTKPSACNDSIPLRAIFLPPGPLRKKPFFGMMKKMDSPGPKPPGGRGSSRRCQANPAAAIRYPPGGRPVLIPSQNKGASCPDDHKNRNRFHSQNRSPGSVGRRGRRAFREVCRALGAAYTVGEMTSSKGLTYQNKKTADLLTLGPSEHPGGIQLFGDDPLTMARAAEMSMAYEPDIIDINMGCPHRKWRATAAAAPDENPELAGRIIREVSRAVPVPGDGQIPQRLGRPVGQRGGIRQNGGAKRRRGGDCPRPHPSADVRSQRRLADSQGGEKKPFPSRSSATATWIRQNPLYACMNRPAWIWS